ncbi:hypothetical protein vseg_001528 [Gypsophila vaccaria]
MAINRPMRTSLMISLMIISVVLASTLSCEARPPAPVPDCPQCECCTAAPPGFCCKCCVGSTAESITPQDYPMP